MMTEGQHDDWIHAHVGDLASRHGDKSHETTDYAIQWRLVLSVHSFDVLIGHFEP